MDRCLGNRMLITLISLLLVSLIFAGTTQAQTTAAIIVDEPAWYKNNPSFPDLGMSLTKGYAPFPVFIQGWNSTPRDDIVRWSWDFGAGTDNDSQGRYFEGFNAAHVFETPGTYTVTLTVEDSQGNSATTSIAVTVMSPNGVTYYVDSTIGNDSYDGKCLAVNVNCGPWKTATKAFSRYYNPGDRILFKRGQTFEVSQSHLDLGLGYYFGAYGNQNDPKPLIQWMGSTIQGDSIVFVRGGAGYIGFVDLQVSLIGPNGWIDGFFGAMCGNKNILFLRDDFFDPSNGAISTNGDGCEPTGNTASNFFLIDSSISNPTTNDRAITQMFFFGAHGLAVIGSSFDKSGNHIAYTSLIDKGLISRNIFNRPAFGRNAWRTIGSGSTHQANNIEFSDNLILGWIDPINCPVCGGTCLCPHGVPAHNGGGISYNAGLITFGPGGNTGSDGLLMNNIVFERNVITNFVGGMNVENAENFTIRNNLFITPSNGTSIVLHADPSKAGAYRPLKNVNIIGNTFVTNGGSYSNTMIDFYKWAGGVTQWGDKHQNINIANNIFYSLNGGANARAMWVESIDGLNSQNNIFYLPNSQNGEVLQLGSARYTLANWQAATQFDLSSSVSNPNFIGPINTKTHLPGHPDYQENLNETAQYRNLLKLSSQSQRGTGFRFPSDSYYDFENNKRYITDQAVDIGAYEYQGPQACTTVSDCTPAPQCKQVQCVNNACVYTNLADRSSCNDNNLCTTSDICSNGTCSGTANVCGDGKSCTQDSCNPATGQCANTPNNGLCDNGVYCDGNEICNPSAAGPNSVTGCVPGTAVSCSADAFPCTQDICNEATHFCGIPNNSLCTAGEVCSLTQGCVAAPANAILNMRFDDTPSDGVLDSSGNGHNGTCVNCPTYLATGGHDGLGAYQFVSPASVTVNDEPSFDIERTDSFSVSAWIQRSAAGRYQAIVAKGIKGANFRGIIFGLDGSVGNRIKLSLTSDSSVGNELNVEGTTVVTDGRWHHVAATYDGSSQASGIKLYVDGNLESATGVVNSLSGTILTDFSLQIGTSQDNDNWQGLIDDVKVYRRVLSASEVVQLFQGGSAVTISSSNPPNGHIDPLEDRDAGTGTLFGIKNISLTFSSAVKDSGGGALSAANFQTRCVRNSAAASDLQTGRVPAVTQVTGTGAGPYALTLSDRLCLGAWTEIKAVNVIDSGGNPISSTGNRIVLGFLPVDVTQDGKVLGDDINRWLAISNNLYNPAPLTKLLLLDQRRNGIVAGEDITRAIQLINGIGTFRAWNGFDMGVKP